jgi:hypothetical protein
MGHMDEITDGMTGRLGRPAASLYTRAMKRKKNDKGKLKELSAVCKKILANRKRRGIAREIVPPEIEQNQSIVSRIAGAGKKQRDRERRNRSG